jgi:hypothetical protein
MTNSTKVIDFEVFGNRPNKQLVAKAMDVYITPSIPNFAITA